MKKLIAFVSLFVVVTVFSAPVFAEAGAGGGQEQVKNVKVGVRNASTGCVEILDSTHTEAAKGKGAGEQITGVVAGGAIGIRKAVHRAGAGAIDLLTFWIPKKQPIINPEKARLE